jgi:hypothetical protein
VPTGSDWRSLLECSALASRGSGPQNESVGFSDLVRDKWHDLLCEQQDHTCEHGQRECFTDQSAAD